MVGKSLSHYRILEELGRGGMGIVYKAEDTKLNRTVAIKVLPSAALGSEADRARFFREAQAAAQLHHANIATVFAIEETTGEGEDARPFIAMEYIEGETLTDRIERGPIKLDEAVRIATQVAEALEAAHEKNIVHRDIKSGNVMLTSKGVAKVLDFGLAKTSHSTKLTQLGSTLGTIAYMSPEQARGEEVDRRSDLWSLGVLLYEMITGRMPFASAYEQAAVYSILNEDPEPLTAIRTGIPMPLEWLVMKCLAKNATDRYQSATDLIVDLRTLDLKSKQQSTAAVSPLSERGLSNAQSPVKRNLSNWAKPLVIGVSAFIIGAVAMRLITPTERKSVRKFEFPAPGLTALAVSHAGDRFAYVQNDTLYARNFSALEPRLITSTSASQITWSPDDNQIAMVVGQDLYSVSGDGGQAQRIATFEAGTIKGIAWLPSGEILVSVRSGFGFGEIYSMPEEGGRPEVIRSTDRSREIASFDHLASVGRPDEFVATVNNYNYVATIRLLTGERDDILLDDEDLVLVDMTVSPDGFLAYADLSGIWAIALRSDFRGTSGTPTRIAPAGAVRPSFSRSGTLAYIQMDLVDARVVWKSDSGETEAVLGGELFAPQNIRIHPDEERAVVSRQLSTMWMLDTRGSEVPIQTGYDHLEKADDWLSDGRRLIISSTRDGPGTFYVVDISGVKRPEKLFTFGSTDMWAASLSPDEKTLAFYAVSSETRRDLYYVDIEITDDSVTVSSDPKPFLVTPNDEALPDISPSGDLLAYQTNASGRWQIEVRTFPDANRGYWPITVDGGYRARWHPSGRSIYYMTEDGFLWRVSFDHSAAKSVGTPERLFRVDDVGADPYAIPYDIGSKTGRIAAVQLVREPAPPAITIVENWKAELER